MKMQITVLVSIVFFAAGCSFDHLARRQMARMTLDIVSVYDRETDVELVRTTLSTSLKLLEGAIKSDSNNAVLLTAAARGYSRYTWGFIEPEIEQARFDGDTASVSKISARAADFYHRAKEFGERALQSGNSDFPSFETCDFTTFENYLQQLDSIDADALYWAAFAWGNLLRFQVVSGNLPTHLTKVRMMLERVIQLGNSFYIAQAHTFLGAFYASLPPILGRNMELANKHLAEGIDIRRGEFLPARLAYARYYQFLIGDQGGYRVTLQAIVDAPAGNNQSFALDNAVAKAQARSLLERCQDK